ncbi:hypothetical protein GF362_04565 [Candidatus Dojkabacteria bacterium]|nr:hypothetical protein [Candidatus Dojkabacteria bacterium]
MALEDQQVAQAYLEQLSAAQKAGNEAGIRMLLQEMANQPPEVKRAIMAIPELTSFIEQFGRQLSRDREGRPIPVHSLLSLHEDGRPVERNVEPESKAEEVYDGRVPIDPEWRHVDDYHGPELDPDDVYANSNSRPEIDVNQIVGNNPQARNMFFGWGLWQGEHNAFGLRGGEDDYPVEVENTVYLIEQFGFREGLNGRQFQIYNKAREIILSEIKPYGYHGDLVNRRPINMERLARELNELGGVEQNTFDTIVIFLLGMGDVRSALEMVLRADLFAPPRGAEQISVPSSTHRLSSTFENAFQVYSHTARRNFDVVMHNYAERLQGTGLAGISEHAEERFKANHARERIELNQSRNFISTSSIHFEINQRNLRERMNGLLQEDKDPEELRQFLETKGREMANAEVVNLLMRELEYRINPQDSADRRFQEAISPDTSPRRKISGLRENQVSTMLYDRDYEERLYDPDSINLSDLRQLLRYPDSYIYSLREAIVRRNRDLRQESERIESTTVFRNLGEKLIPGLEYLGAVAEDETLGPILARQLNVSIEELRGSEDGVAKLYAQIEEMETSTQEAIGALEAPFVRSTEFVQADRDSLSRIREQLETRTSQVAQETTAEGELNALAVIEEDLKEAEVNIESVEEELENLQEKLEQQQIEEQRFTSISLEALTLESEFDELNLAVGALGINEQSTYLWGKLSHISEINRDILARQARFFGLGQGRAIDRLIRQGEEDFDYVVTQLQRRLDQEVTRIGHAIDRTQVNIEGETTKLNRYTQRREGLEGFKQDLES